MPRRSAAPSTDRPRTARSSRTADSAERSAIDAAEPVDRGATQRIVDSITGAIVERRLRPGTKLAEQKLADIYGVSRTLVRQALNQLSRDRLVRLEPGRGACVAEPSLAEAQQVFELRRWLESSMLRALANRIDAAQIATLHDHLTQEAAAVARTDVPGRTRLLADFHVLLARLHGNDVLAELLADLLSRSSLIALMYQSSHSAEHSQAEHVAIVEALARHDGAAAVALLDDHLGQVARHLRPTAPVPDLASALQPDVG